MPEKSVKSFKDVKGCDEAMADLQEIVEYLKTPGTWRRLLWPEQPRLDVFEERSRRVLPTDKHGAVVLRAGV